jgi:hypothetical protein
MSTFITKSHHANVKKYQFFVSYPRNTWFTGKKITDERTFFVAMRSLVANLTLFRLRFIFGQEAKSFYQNAF